MQDSDQAEGVAYHRIGPSQAQFLDKLDIKCIV